MILNLHFWAKQFGKKCFPSSGKMVNFSTIARLRGGNSKIALVASPQPNYPCQITNCFHFPFWLKGGGAHLLQFKVSLTHSTQDILETQRAVVDMLAKLRNLATHMHCSLQSSKEFHDMQTESTPLCLVQDVKIRWNSTYLMVKRAWTVKQYIQRFLAEKAILTITPNEYTLMEALLSLLEPIFQLTQMLSSNVSSVSIVIPSIQAIVVRM